MAKRVVLPPDNIAEWNVVKITLSSRRDLTTVLDWVNDEMLGQYYVRTVSDWPQNHNEFCFESADDIMWFRMRWG